MVWHGVAWQGMGHRGHATYTLPCTLRGTGAPRRTACIRTAGARTLDVSGFVWHRNALHQQHTIPNHRRRSIRWNRASIAPQFIS